MNVLSAIYEWFDERTGLNNAIMHVITHPVPPGAKWAYVFGTAIMTAFIVQIATGVCLLTMFSPSAGQAYDTIIYITKQAPFGALIRGMHYYGASAMILFVGVHAIQTYLYGSYKYPRELNWVSGVALLFLTVGIGFTGQILRWDQIAIWTVAVGAEQALRAPLVGPWLVNIFLSGGSVSSSTLSHFFALHVAVLPGLLVAIVGLHVYLVLHHGISEPPVPGELVDPKTYKQKYQDMLKRIGKPFWPDAAWRDILFSAVVVVGIAALAAYFGPPPIEKPPDPSLIEAYPRPDWYLLWYFALLALLPHGAENAVIILAPLIGIIALFSVPFISNKGERSWKRRPWAVGYVVLIVSCIAALWYEGVRTPWTPNFAPKMLDKTVIGATSGPIFDGAQVFNDKGCLYCHMISGRGGQRGPDLTKVGDRLSHDQIVIRIVNGGYNMPAYAGNISPKDLQSLTAFLESRR